MSRYIEVNEFYDKMYEWVRMHGGIIRNEMQAILEAVTSIDIVRCGECKHWHKGVCLGIPFSGDDASYIDTESDDFCSYGEVRDEMDK